MLRVGLTGGLGSGKSTAGAMLAAHGAYLFSSDAVAREMMEPGEAVHETIVKRFGAAVQRADGALDRAVLARIAFVEGRLEELNDIVHPAVIERQQELTSQIGKADPKAVVVVESALLFETRYGGEGGWRSRFDRIILVVAREETRIQRYVARIAAAKDAGYELTAEERRDAERDASRRIAQQIPDDRKVELCDYILHNDGTLPELQRQVDDLWPALVAEAC